MNAVTEVIDDQEPEFTPRGSRRQRVPTSAVVSAALAIGVFGGIAVTAPARGENASLRQDVKILRADADVVAKQRQAVAGAEEFFRGVVADYAAGKYGKVADAFSPRVQKKMLELSLDGKSRLGDKHPDPRNATIEVLKYIAAETQPGVIDYLAERPGSVTANGSDLDSDGEVTRVLLLFGEQGNQEAVLNCALAGFNVRVEPDSPLDYRIESPANLVFSQLPGCAAPPPKNSSASPTPQVSPSGFTRGGGAPDSGSVSVTPARDGGRTWGAPVVTSGRGGLGRSGRSV